MYIEGQFFPGNEITNPAANAILADTGAINKGGDNGTHCVFQFWVCSTVNARVRLAVLNAANTVVQSFMVRVGANIVNNWGARVSFQVPNNFKVRLISEDAVVGTMSAAIIMGTFATY